MTRPLNLFKVNKLAHKIFNKNHEIFQKIYSDNCVPNSLVFKSVCKNSHYYGEYTKMILELKNVVEKDIVTKKQLSSVSQNIINYFNASPWWPKIGGTHEEILQQIKNLPPRKETYQRIIVLEKFPDTITNENIQKEKDNCAKPYFQYRGNVFRVLNIFNKLNPNIILNSTLDCSAYIETTTYNGKMLYTKGEIAKSDFNNNLHEEYGSGIYYFDTIDKAFNHSSVNTIEEITYKIKQAHNNETISFDDVENCNENIVIE